MAPDEIVVALARHGTRIAIKEGRLCLIPNPGTAPPTELVNAAREAKVALRQIAEAQDNADAEYEQKHSLAGEVAATPMAVLRVIAVAPAAALSAAAGKAPELLLQAWGAAPEDARQLVQRLHAQRANVGKIVTDFANASYPKRDKLERLTNKLLRMERERARRDAILAGLSDGSKTQAQLAAIAGMTDDVASKLLARMLREGEITKTGYGTYALPQQTETAYTPTDAAIINALLALPDFRGNIAQLIDGTGRDRIPIYDNAKRMAAKGCHLVRLTRGHGVKAVFELSGETLDKIQRGEPIRLGHKLVVFDLPARASGAGRCVR